MHQDVLLLLLELLIRPRIHDQVLRHVLHQEKGEDEGDEDDQDYAPEQVQEAVQHAVHHDLELLHEAHLSEEKEDPCDPEDAAYANEAEVQVCVVAAERQSTVRDHKQVCDVPAPVLCQEEESPVQHQLQDNLYHVERQDGGLHDDDGGRPVGGKVLHLVVGRVGGQGCVESNEGEGHEVEVFAPDNGCKETVPLRLPQFVPPE
mmetsp:Transcript_70950/g.207920  ORF Transcript_70950/g.207920 Transcript_70950/m.207920 type:complete len:204 (+) Transcript_70950:671-1282(+)